MRVWIVLPLVLLLICVSLTAFAQPAPGAGGAPPGGQPGGPGPFRPGGYMPMPTPVVTVFEGFMYVILGNQMYKIDPKEMKVVGFAFLMPPGAMPGGPGMPPPPAGF